MTDSVEPMLSEADLALTRSTLFKTALNIPMPPLPVPPGRSDKTLPARQPVLEIEPLIGMAHSYLGLAEVARARGDLSEARHHYESALDIFRSLSARPEAPGASAHLSGTPRQRSTS